METQPVASTSTTREETIDEGSTKRRFHPTEQFISHTYFNMEKSTYCVVHMVMEEEKFIIPNVRLNAVLQNIL